MITRVIPGRVKSRDRLSPISQATGVYNRYMPRKQPKSHTAEEFDLDVLSSDIDIFRCFLLCYLFGKPIRSETAVATWRSLSSRRL